MKQIDSLNFRKLLCDAGVAIMGMPVKESLTYMPYGSKIRDILYGNAIKLLVKLGYEKVILSDMIDPNKLKEIDKISKVSKGYMKVENKDLMIAAGHEINAYLYVKELLKHNIKLPIKIYNFGSVYRENKNTKFPFNLGERKSFLECYAVFKDDSNLNNELEIARIWNKTIIKDILHIPSVEVSRPIATNKKISKKTICIDSITPLGETVITGMTYLHDDIFTNAINLKYKDMNDGKNKLAHSIHFGLSENILFSYLLNSCDGENLRLYSFIAPIQVSVINSVKLDKNKKIVYDFFELLKSNNIRCEIEELPRNKINSKICINRKKGIPISVVIKEDYDNINIKLFCGNIEDNILILNNDLNTIDIISKIDNLLIKNDENITFDMKQRQENSIITCENLDELDDIVKSGKIAKIHLKENDDSVYNVESYLTGGEILGYQIEKEKGIDIITGENIDTIAYVSRRS